jgi:hypothetical protein
MKMKTKASQFVLFFDVAGGGDGKCGDNEHIYKWVIQHKTT